MKASAFTFWFVIGCAMLAAGGCAKQAVIKSEAPLVSNEAATDHDRAERSGGVMPEAGAHEIAAMKAETHGNETKNGSTSEYAALEPITGASELKADLDAIHFDLDSYLLSPEAKGLLVKNVERMKQAPGISVRIEGHCDERGSAEYNLALGEKRARAAMQYMETMGIPRQRLSVISFGKEKPVAFGHDQASWARNRRDEFALTTE